MTIELEQNDMDTQSTISKSPEMEQKVYQDESRQLQPAIGDDKSTMHSTNINCT